MLSLLREVQLRRAWNSTTLTTWVSFGARSGGLLLITPLVLRTFSPAEISLWFIFLAIASMQMMADFGFGSSFIRAIAYASAGRRALDDPRDLVGKENQSLLRQIFYCLRKCYGRLSVATFSLGVTLGTVAIYKPISELSSPIEGWFAWSVVLVCTTLVFKNNIFSIWLQGRSQVPRLRRTEAALSLASTLTTALTIFIFRSFVAGVIAAQFTTLLATSGIKRLAVKDTIFERGQSPIDIDHRAIYKFVWPAAWRSGIGVLMSTIVIQASGIIYAQFVSPELAAPYLLAMRVMQMILQVSMAPFYSKIPWFSSLYGAGRFDLLIPAAQKSIRVSHGVFAAGVVFTGFFASPLLNYIGSQTQFVSPFLWYLLGFAYLLERIGAMHLQFYSLSNHILWHIANGISGTLYLIATLLLLSYVGVYAFPIGMIIGYAGFYTWFCAKLAYRHYHLHALKFELSASAPSLIIIVAFLAIFSFQRT